jgi:acetyl esterase/lipase
MLGNFIQVGRVRITFLTLNLFLTFYGYGQKDLLHQRYGNFKQNTLDLYLPASISENTPVIVMLHGGAWMMGGNEYTAKTARDLRDRGFVVANVDYRYVSDSVHANDLLEDIDHAVAYLKKSAAQYHFKNSGYHFSGISAGAHLALLYSYTKGRDIKSIAVLCAPVKLDDLNELAFIQNNGLLHNIELLADAKAIENQKPGTKFTDVSPYAHIKKIPTLLFHGDKDNLVPYRQATFMFEKLQNAKVQSKLVTMHGKGHDCGMNQADSEKLVLDEITKWIIDND